MPVDRSRIANPFEFVNVAGARARQLLNGSLPRVEGPGKPAGTATREVAEGHVQKIDETTPAVDAAAPPAAVDESL
jgi:DNA-directed RNA polymerase subunit K/omega